LAWVWSGPWRRRWHACQLEFYGAAIVQPKYCISDHSVRACKATSGSWVCVCGCVSGARLHPTSEGCSDADNIVILVGRALSTAHGVEWISPVLISSHIRLMPNSQFWRDKFPFLHFSQICTSACSRTHLDCELCRVGRSRIIVCWTHDWHGHGSPWLIQNWMPAVHRAERMNVSGKARD
jgi:hypothetical protein